MLIENTLRNIPQLDDFFDFLFSFENGYVLFDYICVEVYFIAEEIFTNMQYYFNIFYTVIVFYIFENYVKIKNEIKTFYYYFLLEKNNFDIFYEKQNIVEEITKNITVVHNQLQKIQINDINREISVAYNYIKKNSKEEIFNDFKHIIELLEVNLEKIIEEIKVFIKERKKNYEKIKKQ